MVKSKVLKIRNLPDGQLLNRITVKPVQMLVVILTISFLLIIFRSSYTLLAVILLAIAVFALLVMPDRTLMEFTEQYVVLFNCKDRTECTILYWDEIVMWEYIKKNNVDQLRIEMIDGRIETSESFQKGKVVQYFRVFAKGKEKRPSKQLQVKKRA